MDYQAFVYEYTNTTNGKKYIGYHKGHVNDGYVFSSNDEELKEAYNNFELQREILDTGTVEQMAALERQLLLSVDAANNAMYYNKSNNGNYGKLGDTQYRSNVVFKQATEIMNAISAKIDNNEYEIVMTPISEFCDIDEDVSIDKINRNQVRREMIDEDNISRHINKIEASRLKAEKPKFAPVVIVTNYPYNVDGKTVALTFLVDGNHRVSAYKACGINKIETIVLDYVKDFKRNDQVIHCLGSRFNSTDTVRKLHTEADRRYRCQQLAQSGMDLNSPEILEMLCNEFQIDPITMGKEVASAVRRFERDNAAIAANFIRVHKSERDKIVEYFKKKHDDAFVHITHSGDPTARLGYYISDFMNSESKAKKHIVVVYHNSYENTQSSMNAWKQNATLAKQLLCSKIEDIKLVEIPWSKPEYVEFKKMIEN